jgi:hypothetical protein
MDVKVLIEKGKPKIKKIVLFFVENGSENFWVIFEGFKGY